MSDYTNLDTQGRNLNPYIDVGKNIFASTNLTEEQKLIKLEENLKCLSQFTEQMGFVFLVVEERSKKIHISSGDFDNFMGLGLIQGAYEKEKAFHNAFFSNNQRWFEAVYRLRKRAAALPNSKVHPEAFWAKIVGASYTNPVSKVNKRFFISQVPILGSDSRPNRSFSFYVVEDITHLLKGNHFWIRLIPPSNMFSDESIYFNSKESKVVRRKDVISGREKEIANELEKHIDSREIARRLFISTHTVDKHRKNMLAEIGARDTTSLVLLLRKAKLL